MVTAEKVSECILNSYHLDWYFTEELEYAYVNKEAIEIATFYFDNKYKEIKGKINSSDDYYASATVLIHKGKRYFLLYSEEDGLSYSFE